jgi:phytanoyl-CoA hydroxylase
MLTMDAERFSIHPDFQLNKLMRTTTHSKVLESTNNTFFTANDIQQFHQDGFVIVRGLASDEQCKHMLDIALEHLEQQIEPVEYEADLHYPGSPASRSIQGGKTIRRLLQAYSRAPVFSQWVSSPSLQGRLKQLIGSRIVMPLAHHNCIMTKHHKFSSDTGWHQDIRYWSFQKSDLVTAWLALGPEYEENGGLRIIPGSHRATIQYHQRDDAQFLRTDLPENQDLIKQSINVHLEAGDVLFFHSLLLHSANRNRTEKNKTSVVFTFRSIDNPPRPDTRSASLPELLFP